MAFPTSATDETARKNTAFRMAAQLKQRSTILRNTSAAGDTDADLYFDWAIWAAGIRNRLIAVNTPSLGLDADFNPMLTALTNAIEQIKTDTPTSGGYVVIKSISGGTGEFSIVERQFTSGATAGVRTTLQALIDAIA